MSHDPEDGPAPLAGAGDAIRHTPAEPRPADAPAAGSAPPRSLVEDVEALIDDVRTYIDAELSYQKSRISFATDRLKKTIVFALAAVVIAVLAAIGLTVGLIIALTPLLTGWGATAVVVGAMLLAVYLLLRRAAQNWNNLMSAVRKDDGGTSDELSGG